VTGSAARSYNRGRADKLVVKERLNTVSRPGNRSWDEMVESLRAASAQVRSALGRAGSASTGDDAAAARLKSDVTRLEQSASELISNISAGLRERRSEIETSIDRERAQRSAEQMKSSLQELAELAGSVTADIASAANSTLKQSEPELKKVARALEDVAGSAASWIRTTIDPAKEQPGERTSQSQPPLDDL
jgi:uncharacterized phage infection (PIP) family protein YhgE